jgi:cytochrome c oxidase subunit I+III
MHISGLLGMPRRVYTYGSGLGWDLPNLLSTIGAIILALGVVATVVNVLRSLRTGREAGDNPWEAGTLEWSVSSPPPSYNILRIPIIRSREPLWPDRSIGGAGPRESVLAAEMVEDQEKSHDGLREAFSTSVMDAEPRAIVAIAGASYWPLLLAFSLTIAFVGGIIPQTEAKLLAVLVGGVISVFAIIGWLWPDATARKAWQTHDQARLHPLPAEVTGTDSPIWWGMFLYLVAQGTVFGLFVYSYFYLLSNNPDWPPRGVSQPSPGLMATATLLLLLTPLLAFAAERSIKAGRTRLLALALAATFLVGLSYLVLQVIEWFRLDFHYTEHAYGSIFFVLAALVAGQVLVALVMNAMLQVRTWLGHFSSRRYLAVQNLGLYTYFNAAIAGVTFVTLYIAPRLLERG